MIVTDKLRIIHADHDPYDLEIFARAVTEMAPNATLTSVIGGEALIQELANENKPKPDIVFLENNMPFYGNYTCLDEMRDCKEFREIPIVMHTSSKQKSDIQYAFAHGANLYFIKPGKFQQLKNGLYHILCAKDHLIATTVKEFILQIEDGLFGKHAKHKLIA